MTVPELARIGFAVNFILEKASSSLGLSKRSAIGMAMMAVQQPKPMTNNDLQGQFVQWNISTKASANKDASAAKSELLQKGYIEIGDKVSIFSLNEKGRSALETLYREMRRATDEL